MKIYKYMILEGKMKKIGKRVVSAFLAAVLLSAPAGTAIAEEADGETSSTAEETTGGTSEETSSAEAGTSEAADGAEASAEQIMDGSWILTADDPEAAREKARQDGYKIQPESNSLTGWPEGPAVYADSAIVMDMNTGAVLYEKRADVRHYPASITKLLTTLVALENAELTDEVLFSDDSISFLEPGDASIGMTPGEILSLKDALYGVLLASANEVSYAVAENVGRLMGGDYDTFIQEMNDRAAEIGCTNSHWVNANGLHDTEHYTTAHDMAVIASEVYQFDAFREIVQTLSYTIGPTNLVKEDRVFQQNHKMLWPENENYYEYCTGGKTGYTDQARTTLVTMADNGDLQLAAVVLYDFGNDAYVDTREILDYAFDNFEKVLLSDQEKPEGIEAYTEMDSYIVLPTGIGFSDLDQEIEITDEQNHTGTVTYTYQGQNVGSADVVLTREYVAAQTQGADGEVQVSENSAQKSSLPFIVKLIIGIVIAAVVLFLAFFAVLKYRQIQRRRRRRARRRRAGAAHQMQHNRHRNGSASSGTQRPQPRRQPDRPVQRRKR